LLSQKRLFIDSSAMHIATALKLSSTVMWMGTDPKVFGYDINTNILANAPDLVTNLDNPYFQKYALFEDLSRCPYSDLSKIFNAEDIIKSLL